MNKGEIRTRVLEQVDWQPDQSTSFKDKVDHMINRAYNLLSLEAPFLFFEDECRVITQKDVKTRSHASDKLYRVADDSRVLKRTAVDSEITAGNIDAFVSDGTWDGRLIEVELSTGETRRRQIRHIISGSTAVVDGVTYRTDTIVLDTPWDDATSTGAYTPDLTYRIFTPEYNLPADVIELRSARLYGDTHYELSVRNQHDMERYDYVDYQGQYSGRPSSVFRGRHHQIDAPTVPATTETDDQDPTFPAWQGPDTHGTFEYCFTYVWGKRDKELQAPNGLYEPRWESSPSIITEKVSTTGKAIKLTFPFIDQGLDDYYFLDSGSLSTRPGRATNSALKIRIYVRRSAHQNSGKIPNHPMNDGVFYLLDEIEGSAVDGLVQYTHDGSKMPEYKRRLKEVHGYQTLRFHPMPDARYEVDCRVLRKPQKLISDQDAPRVHAEAIGALIQKTIVFIHMMEGATDSASLAEQGYQSMLRTLTKRYGLIARARPKKKMARARRPIRDVRVRYTES
tara:strand:+ start:12357 stop:13883 length:1527 start_codon:yes stop_codon:yes gene_type:complete